MSKYWVGDKEVRLLLMTTDVENKSVKCLVLYCGTRVRKWVGVTELKDYPPASGDTQKLIGVANDS